MNHVCKCVEYSMNIIHSKDCLFFLALCSHRHTKFIEKFNGYHLITQSDVVITNRTNDTVVSLVLSSSRKRASRMDSGCFFKLFF